MTAARFASSGKPVRLGALLAKGGEGAIHPLDDRPGHVAKIYLKPPTSEKSDKLRAMSDAKTEALLKVCAWPTELLLGGDGKLAGFVMPRVAAGQEAHELYTARSRAGSFPQADFRFIVHVAANVARAFATIHAAGHVIGDVNHAHVLIGGDGRVVLIDVDSIQVSVPGQIFTCDVGQPLFTPPELQAHAFRGLHRTANHDLFGLAVLMFHMLFMGRHPFAGVWGGPGDMPIEKAIAESRFAYGESAAAMRMRRPPGTLALDTFGSPIADLFERAFAGGEPERPSAADWLAALGDLGRQLQGCDSVASHHFPKASAQCPWCTIEQATGVRLFGMRSRPVKAATATDIASLWGAIESVKPPAADPQLAFKREFIAPPGWPDPMLNRVRRIGSMIAGIASVILFINASVNGWIVLGIMIAAPLLWPFNGKKRRRAAAGLAQARQRWRAIEDRWKREASRSAFAAKKAELDGQRRAYLDLRNERARRLARLEIDKREHQLARYLDGFRISKARIPGIGQSRIAILTSFGVETAYDVQAERIEGIMGFGPKLTGDLLNWRRSEEGKFLFNPKEPIDPQEIARVEGEIAELYQRYLHALKHGHAALTTLAADIVAARPRLLPVMETAWLELKRAEAEVAAL